MTKTFTIKAWCLRPFIGCMEVEAETPELAIAIARQDPEALVSAAEECSRGYPWDDFAAYDESGNELLHDPDPWLEILPAPTLRQASSRLVTAAEILDAALDGAAGQFESLRAYLSAACRALRTALAKAGPP